MNRNKEKILQLLKQLQFQITEPEDDNNIDEIVPDKRKKQAFTKTSRNIITSPKFGLLNLTIASLIHQLNQPLTVISLLLENSLENLKYPPISYRSLVKNIQDCLTETHYASSMITELRDVTQNIYSKKTDIVKLLQIARRISAALSANAKNAGLKIILKIDDTLTFQGNAAAIEQILFILIQNAIEATVGKRFCRLVISASKRKGLLCLKFADNCCGISKENLEKIFEPAFTTKKNNKGFGLPIVQHIVHILNGNIEVKSLYGKGTTFLITLPISP